MKENDVVLRIVTKIVVFILLTFGSYICSAGHNNSGGGFIGGFVFSSAFILIFLAFDVEKVLDSLPIDFRELMVIGALISLITAIASTFFGEPFLYQSEFTLHLPIFNEMYITTVTIFELGIVLSVVGVIVTVTLALSGDKS